MTVPVPKFDRREAVNVAAEVRGLLVAAGWPEDDRKKGFEEALIQIFGRFAELIIHRLNQAPEKNFLAFLDLLGVSQLPMQAARVPLTFSMAPGSAVCARVPRGTQVAAPPPPGQQKPVIYETERELMVTPAKLDSLLIKFGALDRYKDLGSTLLLPSDPQAIAGAGAAALTPVGALAIPHVLHVGVPWNASWPQIDQLRVRFVMEEGAGAVADARWLQWEMPTVDDPPRAVAGGAKPAASVAAVAAKIALTPQEDGTKSLMQSGDVVFANPPKIAPVAIDGVVANWLSCRLLTPITRSIDPVEGMVRGSQLPAVKQLTCEMELARQGLAIEQGFYNAQKLDLTKDFFPFGERPKFGDVLYLGSREVFSDPDAQVTLHVELTNPSSGGADVGLPETATHNTQLSWEFWNGQVWTKLGRSGRFLRVRVDDSVDDAAGPEFADETNSLSSDGDVKFRFTSPPQETAVNGQKNYWVRARIAAGNYGEDAQVQKSPTGPGVVVTPATLAPPSIKAIKVDYAVKKEAPATAVLTYNDFAYARTDPKGAFKPFVPVAPEDASTSVAFGFSVDAPQGAKPTGDAAGAEQGQVKQGKFPNQSVTAYLAAGDAALAKSEEPDGMETPASWEYWNGLAWKRIPVRDESQGFRRSGMMQFLAPADFATKKEFGRERYWLRVRPNGEGSDAAIRSVYLNTTMAVQGISVVNDLLGTSNGKPSQKFQTIQTSVLPGQKLQVLEPTLPPLRERELIQHNEGEDAIETVKDPKGKADQYWVTWHEVVNFYGSGARDRHYVLDHVTGELTFGDGAYGMIPPVLPGNIRVASYCSGGGEAGNQAAQAVTKLNSAVPYIQKVVNWIPAAGGTDAEGNAMLLERGSRGVRHGGRAVTWEDFEDLAMLASRDVARAKCVPLCDLSREPAGRIKRPGVISVIVAPSSTDARPMPSSELLDRVREYLDASGSPGVEVVVVGPEYLRVNVEAEIAVSDPGDANEVELAVREELESYLHPISGGLDGRGWEFGGLPQKFDLSVRIERIPGVSHVRELRVSVQGRAGAEKTGRFLTCCGEHKVAMVLEDQHAVEFA